MTKCATDCIADWQLVEAGYVPGLPGDVAICYACKRQFYGRDAWQTLHAVGVEPNRFCRSCIVVVAEASGHIRLDGSIKEKMGLREIRRSR
jgi:hypothetical protein